MLKQFNAETWISIINCTSQIMNVCFYSMFPKFQVTLGFSPPVYSTTDEFIQNTKAHRIKRRVVAVHPASTGWKM